MNVGLAAATAAGVVLLLWVGAVLDRGRRPTSPQPTGTARPRSSCSPRPASPPCRPGPTRPSRWSPGAAAAAFEEDFTHQHDRARRCRRPGRAARAGPARATDPAVRDALAGAATRSPSGARVARRSCAASTTAASTRRRSRSPSAPRSQRGGSRSTGSTTARGGDRHGRAGRSTTGPSSAGGALTGAGFGWTVLTLVLLAGVVVGLQQTDRGVPMTKRPASLAGRGRRAGACAGCGGAAARRPPAPSCVAPRPDGVQDPAVIADRRRRRGASLRRRWPACGRRRRCRAPGAMPAGSTMATIAARGRLIVGVDQNTYLFGFRDADHRRDRRLRRRHRQGGRQGHLRRRPNHVQFVAITLGPADPVRARSTRSTWWRTP